MQTPTGHPTSEKTASTPDHDTSYVPNDQEAAFEVELGAGVDRNPADAELSSSMEEEETAADDAPKSAKLRQSRRTEDPTQGVSSATKPVRSAHQPAPALLVLAVFGIVIGAVGGLFLVGHPDTRYTGLALVFFAGALSVWRMMVDDRRMDREAIAQKDAKIRRLMTRCEELEDAAWELRESDERQASILSTLGDIVLRRDDANRVVYANSAADFAFGPRDRALTGCALSLRQLMTEEESDIRKERSATDHAKTVRASASQTAEDALSTMMANASLTDIQAVSSGFQQRHEHKPVSETAFSDRPIALGDVRLNTRMGPRWFSRMDIHVRDTVTDQPLVQTVLRDVTDRREMENELVMARHLAESSNEAKSRFLATVSHEIRTPLNGILGMATLMRDTRLTKEQSAYLDALETSGETLLLLIDEVLDFSKVEAGKLHIEAEPTELATVVENVVELLAPKAQAKGLEIGSYIAPDLPKMVTLDATRMRQILFNLAGNGVKFTESGGVSLRIAGEPGKAGGTDLKIEVRDTGIGFQEGDAERLFEEFEQLDHGRARKFGGTGLGLAIAKRLCELMGGAIMAMPADDGGALFKVSIPVPETLPDAQDRQTGVLKGRFIALIGSGPVEMPLLAERLSQQGADARVFAPGDASLDGVLETADLVIIDNSTLSDSAGWLATARLCGCNAHAVVLVAPSERDRLERLREAGYAAYLIRPVRMESLVSVLEGLLDKGEDSQFWGDPKEPQGSEPDYRRPDHAPARPLKLLVAEDNDINRLLTDALLRKLGHEAVLVNNGEEAVDAAAEQSFDAILMDLHMPGLDGIGAIQKIRDEETRLGARETPIFMVTADVMEDAKQKAASAGAAGYLTKPLNADAIAQALSPLQKGCSGTSTSCGSGLC